MSKINMTAAELLAYRIAKFFNYNSEFDIELKALQEKEKIQEEEDEKQRAQRVIWLTKKENATKRNKANKLARGFESQRIKDLRTSGRK